MKVLVPVKRVLDYNLKVRVKPDGSGVDLSNLKMSINPFCEIAVEEAVRMKEGGGGHAAGAAKEVIAVSIGPEQAQETLRNALAIGADRGILVKAEGEVEPLAVAKLLKAVIEAEKPDLVILGKQAIDDDSNADRPDAGRPARLAAGDVRVEDRAARRQGERDARSRWRAANHRRELPAIVTTDLRLNEPRYASLPNIMKAKKKPIDVKTPADLGVDVSAAPARC